ncbi:MAG: DNA polymerase/3'-5' exonuclease PolX [Patescibacteria group bacterium]
MTNQEIAKILHEMAELLEMKEVEFKPRAYEKAALGVEGLDREVRDVYKERGFSGLMEIPGVGRGIAEHIEGLLKNGKFAEYEKLKKEIPVNITELSAVEGVGPKMIKILYKNLKIKNLNDLEKAAKAGKISGLARFGKKSEEKILKGIEFLKKSGGRRILGEILPVAEKILERLRTLPGVEGAEFGGSMRRMKETIGDLDFVAFSAKPSAVVERFVKFPEVQSVHEKGGHKALVRLNNNTDADIWVTLPRSKGAALIAWTGDKQHNIAIRTLAEKKGWMLNDYGLWKGKKLLASKTEEEVYKKLGLAWIPPEIRNNTGELEAAQKGKLPKLVEYGDLRGDLQVQTDWTDGENSILEMAHAAKKAGLEYIAITDHTKSLAMTGGADEKKLLRQIEEIKKINKKISGIKILSGAEVNIMKDGSLDIKDEVLSKLDVVGAAVHSHFNLSREEQTKRVINAMNNPNIDIIFHLTGRVIGRREAIQIDVDEIIKTAKRKGTILEIDAYPERLDIKDEYIRKCVEAGVKMVIDSDAHSVNHFKYLELGIAQARRGWAKKSDIVNTKPLAEFLKSLK